MLFLGKHNNINILILNLILIRWQFFGVWWVKLPFGLTLWKNVSLKYAFSTLLNPWEHIAFDHVTGSMKGIVLLAFGFNRILEEVHTCPCFILKHSYVAMEWLSEPGWRPEWVCQEGERRQWWWGWWGRAWGRPSGRCTHCNTAPDNFSLFSTLL